MDLLRSVGQWAHRPSPQQPDGQQTAQRQRTAVQRLNARRRLARERFRNAVRKVILMRKFASPRTLRLENALITNAVHYDVNGLGVHLDQDPATMEFGVFTQRNSQRMYRPFPMVAFHAVSMRDLGVYVGFALGLLLMLFRPSLFVPLVRAMLEFLLQTKLTDLSSALMTDVVATEGWKRLVTSTISYAGGILQAAAIFCLALAAYIGVGWLLWRVIKGFPQKLHESYFWKANCPYCHFDIRFRLLLRFRCNHCGCMSRFDDKLRLLVPLDALPLPASKRSAAL
ncbi:hypothetical protein CAOG_05275 [Capsaspora owczarzaki ATCC 30864]|uniref:Uncharacterized protein n=1 Tax=Capsaspora owczarzaki (strain ATCC 30864) TaxID=595528 RepID=A0A0D2VTQ1_CAPO3|nr:hypothetical protein CAOG_05275 [Capsaspora owczarzaki ATCC 30864]KJE94662.1 hypothetical protein CAOG_005275 [Capsaspora owczarzaki ATCC 30864]|eukprot:XP_004346960.1 hypothetical protein CAOG_05275 [Capsaspora owczarzaki ATCC 30864]